MTQGAAALAPRDWALENCPFFPMLKMAQNVPDNGGGGQAQPFQESETGAVLGADPVAGRRQRVWKMRLYR